MAEENVIGGSFVLDTSDLKKGLEAANRAIRVSNSEFQAAASGMGDWTKSSEGLTAKLKQLNTNLNVQQQKVKALADEYEIVAKEKGATSKEAENLKIRLNNEKKALNETQRAMDETSEALKNLGKDTEDADKKTNKFTSTLKGIGGGVAKGAALGIAAIGVAAVGAVAGLVSMTNETREFRQDLSKLERNAKDANVSFELMEHELGHLTAITGETDSSIEGLSNLMAAGFSDNQMESAINGLSGAVVKFPDTLKFESLSDSLQETIKTGEGSGQFVELLGRMGQNTDQFNEGLAKCKTEAERQQYALDALAKTGLAQVNQEYINTNETLYDSALAQYNLTNAMAKMSEKIEPIITMFKGGLADALNGLIGIIDGVEGAADNFANSISDMAKNVVDIINKMIPVLGKTIQALIPALIEGILTALPALGEAVTEILVFLVEELINALPELLEVAIQIIVTLAEGITEAIPRLVPAITQVVISLANTLISNIPVLLKAAIQLLMALVQAIPTVIVSLVNALPTLIDTIITAVLEALPLLLDAAIQLFNALVEAIPIIIDALIENLPKIIDTLITGIVEAVPMLLEASIQLLMALIDAIPFIIELLVVDLPKIIMTITGTLISNIPQILKAAVQLLMGIVKAIPQIVVSLASNMPKILTAIFDGIKSGLSTMKEIGTNLLKGLWNGLEDAKGWLMDKIKSLTSAITDGIKSYFGIKSPSRVFKNEIGKNLAAGIGVGFIEEMNSVKKGIIKSVDMVGDINNTLGTPQFGGLSGADINSFGRNANENVINFTQNNYSPKPLRRVEIWRNTRNAIDSAVVGRG